MQGRIDAIQALLFFDTEGSIKQNLETEDEVLNKIILIPEKHYGGIHLFALMWSKSSQGGSFKMPIIYESSILNCALEQKGGVIVAVRMLLKQ